MNTPMDRPMDTPMPAGTASLAGSLRLWPGRQPAITRTGATGWAAALATGRPAAALPDLMANVHTLCAHGHRLAATLAVQAALGRATTPDGATRLAWQRAVLRDQMLDMAHDWPRLLPAQALPPLALACAPPWQAALPPAVQLAVLPGWLAQHWLGQPLQALLQALLDDPAAAALRWARRTDTPLARLLASELPPALALPTRHQPLRQPVAPGGPPAEAAAALTPAPVPDTGPWCRHHDAQATPAHNAGMRLVARLTDLLRLASPAGADWLHAGAASPAAGTGHAWVELGRGLLSYELRLADSPQGPVVQTLRITAPTDWNAHPAGVLAQALARTEAHDSSAARRLAAAFSPCAPFSVAPASATAPGHGGANQEAAHA